MLKSSVSRVVSFAVLSLVGAGLSAARADSINSPNITMNVDTNRAAGPGAGGVPVTINTITLAELSLPEYSSGADKSLRLQVRRGYQFDPTSPVSIESATVGFNGAAVGTPILLVPSGTANEILTFVLTSGTSTTVQDIIRINGIKLLIADATGAAGPAQVTMSVTTTGIGGAFTDQGIVAANLTVGAPDRLVFVAQPGSTTANGDLLPAVKMVDFGGNIVRNSPRNISLAFGENPGGATLEGVTTLPTVDGVATWSDADDLRIATAGAGYTLQASQDGAAFLSADSVESGRFDITAGPANHLVISTQPVDTIAGETLLVGVIVRDAADNLVTAPPVDITLDAAPNLTTWPLLVDTSLTKSTVNGVATWDATDRLRIQKAIADYRLLASGVGAGVESDPFDITPAPPAALRFVQQPSDVEVSAIMQPAVSVEITDAFGNRSAELSAVELTLRSTCEGGLSGGSAPAATGLATFEALRVDTSCENVTLEAAAGNLPRIASEPFDVLALPAVRLRFVQQPTTTEEGATVAPPVSLEIIDAAGQRVDSQATVTLSLVSSCGGVLSNASAEAVGGLATFAALTIDTPCAGAALEAASEGLTGVTSNAFDVTAAPPPPVEAITCGACGAGAPVASVPLLMSLGGLKLLGGRRSRRRNRR